VPRVDEPEPGPDGEGEEGREEIGIQAFLRPRIGREELYEEVQPGVRGD